MMISGRMGYRYMPHSFLDESLQIRQVMLVCKSGHTVASYHSDHFLVDFCVCFWVVQDGNCTIRSAVNTPSKMGNEMHHNIRIAISIAVVTVPMPAAHGEDSA